MIKVLHYGLTENLGGIETYLYKLTSNINQEKFQFDFLILGNEKPCYYDELSELGCKFHFVTKRTDSIRKNRSEIEEVMIKEKYDLVHCHLNSLSYITPVLVAVKLNIATIVHSRNAGIPTSKKSRFLHWFNSKRLPQEQIKMLAVSDYAGDWMFGEQAEVQVINNGIDIDKYRFNQEARRKIREEFDINETENLIIHTGALREQKNHSFLLDIYSEINNYDNNTKMLLVGSGNLKDEIKEKIINLDLTEKVLMAGQRMDIADILSAGDYYLFPSFYEGFPNSVIEAETSGLPCLISDTITKEVVIDDNCRQQSLEDPAEVWAKSLLSLSKNAKRDSAAENVAANGFSVTAEISNIENIYSNIVIK